MLDGAGLGREDADRLVAHLPAVAVGAVEEVAAPALAGAGDVGQLVGGAGREQQPARGQGAAVRQAEREAGRRFGHAVARRARRRTHALLLARAASSSAGGIPSRDRKPCMCAAGAFRGVPASTTATRRLRAAEHECCAETGRPAADNHHVIGLGVHGLTVHERGGDRKLRCRFWEPGLAWSPWSVELARHPGRPRRGRSSPEAAADAARRHPDGAGRARPESPRARSPAWRAASASRASSCSCRSPRPTRCRSTSSSAHPTSAIPGSG